MNDITRLGYVARVIYTSITPNSFFRKRVYKKLFGKKLDLKKPIGFNAKISKRILEEKELLYTLLADKYKVRDYVSEKVGSEILIPLIKCYDNVDEININDLPNKFVAKCNHDAGSVVVCDDKKTLDFVSFVSHFKSAINRNMYYTTREWHYKNITRKILIEEMIDIFSDEATPEDYKFHCFNGKVEYIEVQFSRFSSDRRINVYDSSWNLCDFRVGHRNTEKVIYKPECLEKLITISEKLAVDLKYCRIDLYVTSNKKIYFGEITLTSGSGTYKFDPPESDIVFGSSWE